MNNEIRDLILAVFSLRYLGSSPPALEATYSDNLNYEGFYFIARKDSITIGRKVLGSDVTYKFHNVRFANNSLTCSTTINIGVRKITENNLVFDKDSQYSVKDKLVRYIKQSTKSIVYDLQRSIEDFEEFTTAFEGKLDKELFDFIIEVTEAFRKVDYRSQSPTELVSYTPGIPTLNFSRNNDGKIVVAVSSLTDKNTPFLLVGDNATISNIRLCIKNEFGVYKRERLKSLESDMDRTLTRLDCVDAQ